MIILRWVFSKGNVDQFYAQYASFDRKTIRNILYLFELTVNDRHNFDAFFAIIEKVINKNFRRMI